MSDDFLVRNCAPTLAGLKTGSMFPCPCDSRENALRMIRQWNTRLTPKGLRILPLRFTENKVLIYLYRPKMLSRDLSDLTADTLLRDHGYQTDSCAKCVSQLIRKLRQNGDFPHEIGLFLGYPPEDVRGFIENKACGCKCVGCWKVYTDVDTAKKKFRQYKTCSQIYNHLWEQGKNIDQLAISC